MTERKLINLFSSLSADSIHKQLPGRWSDMEMAGIPDHFDSAKEFDREIAIRELMLRSPEVSDGLYYDHFYVTLQEKLANRGAYAQALRWHHATITHIEQHQDDGRDSASRELAETYWLSGDIATALGITTRSLLRDPHDMWGINMLALHRKGSGVASLIVEMMQRGLEVVQHNDKMEPLQAQFPEFLEDALAEVEAENKHPERIKVNEIPVEILQAFRAALQLNEGHPDGADAYLAPLDQLITATDEEYRQLTKEIVTPETSLGRTMGRVYAPELIRMACDDKLVDGPAVTRALDLLRQLVDHNIIEAGDDIATWLAKADGNWKQTLYSPHIGKVGGFTNDELEAIAGDIRYCVYVRHDAANALMARMTKGFVSSERVEKMLRHLLTRPEAHDRAEEELFLGFLIATISDYASSLADLYPEVEAAYREERVDLQIIELSSVQERFGLPQDAEPRRRDDGLYLRLRCKKCSRERTHFVQHVTQDILTAVRERDDEEVAYCSYVMDREIVCPKCGARDQYEMTGHAHLQLLSTTRGLEALMGLATGNKDAPKFTPHPRLSEIRSSAMGREMHPLEAIKQYRQRAQKNPNDPENYIRLGRILRLIRRGPETLAAFKKAYELDPTNDDAVLSYAMAEHDYGSPTHAKDLYNQCLQMAQRGVRRILSPADADSLAKYARQGIRALRKKQPSPFSIEEFVPSVDNPATSQQSRKSNGGRSQKQGSTGTGMKRKKKKLKKRRR
ncbi:MAG: hypothetical protein AAF639_15660 [Chloroflexota bacterium]